MLKAIVFDFDGTVADTLPLIFRGIQHVFHKFAKQTLTDADVVARFGPTEEGIIRAGLAEADYVQAVAEFFQIYKAEHENIVLPNPDVRALLGELKGQGYSLALFTGKGRRAADISLGKLDLAHFFDVILTGDEVHQPKPDPAGIFLALRHLGVTANEAVYVGDSASDMLAAKAAGVVGIAVAWSQTSQSIGTAPFDYRARTTEEFLQLPPFANHL